MNHSADPLILSSVSWKRVLIFYGTPLIVLTMAYILFSPLPLSYVFSYENFTKVTPFRPSPILFAVLLAFFLLTVVINVASLIKSRDKYIWIKEGYLMARSRSVANVNDIDFSNITEKGSWGNRYLSIKTSSGDKLIPLTFCDESIEEIISELHRYMNHRL